LHSLWDGFYFLFETKNAVFNTKNGIFNEVRPLGASQTILWMTWRNWQILLSK
jgi:hypothetical protein